MGRRRYIPIIHKTWSVLPGLALSLALAVGFGESREAAPESPPRESAANRLPILQRMRIPRRASPPPAAPEAAPESPPPAAADTQGHGSCELEPLPPPESPPPAAADTQAADTGEAAPKSPSFNRSPGDGGGLARAAPEANNPPATTEPKPAETIETKPGNSKEEVDLGGWAWSGGKGVFGGAVRAETPIVGRGAEPEPAETIETKPGKEAEKEKIREQTEYFIAQGLANQTLETSNIAYNTPETIQLDDTAVVQLKLSPSLSIDELKKRILEPGKKEGASIPFSRRVEAHLTGSAFKIAALGAEIPRVVEPGRVCEWSWEVTPTQPGTQRLFLTIDAVVAIDGKDAAEYEQVFAKTIEVRVTLGHRVASFVGNNWQWLWTVGLVPLGGWLFARVRCKRLGQKDQIAG